jgi:hypothetical protein
LPARIRPGIDMTSFVRPNGLITNPRRKRAGAVILAIVALLAGCRSESDLSTPGLMHGGAAWDIDAEIARASNLREPILILVADLGQSRADAQAGTLFETLTDKGKSGGIVSVLLDLSVSRNRAEAARFHITNTPVLLCLSPRGLIVTRDPEPITKELVLNRIKEAAPRASELDAKLAVLEAAASRNGNDATAQLELADFLLTQQNAREAIPHLASVARSESAGAVQRVRAWVDLARAHFWITEPEKGRHEAEDLIAVLGPWTADARAGGNLVLGLQDANAKRMAVARREFEAAIAAAPESVYAKQAAEALAKIPGEAK